MLKKQQKFPELPPVCVRYTLDDKNFNFGIIVGKFKRLYLFKANGEVLGRCIKYMDNL
jgi:hypothetical protein